MELEQVSKEKEKVPPGIKRHIKRADSDMTSGSIWRLLITFALPLAAGLLFQQLYNTVDTIVVGKFVGKEALAAVGSTSSIINMLVGLCSGLSMGAGQVVDSKTEEDDGDERQKSHTLSPPYSMGLLSFIIWVSANRMMAAQIASAILPGVVKIRVWNQSSFKK